MKYYQNTTKHIIFCLSGVVLIIAGVLFAILYTVPHGVMQTLPFVLGSIGLYFFVAGLNGALLTRTLKKDDNFAKQFNDFDDERSAFIEGKVKAKVHDFTNMLFLALIVFISVMQVHFAVFLVFVSAYFLRIVVLFYLVRKYNKEM